VVVPSLSALLTNPSWKVLCYQCPLLWAIFVNEMKDHAVLFLSPWPFDEARIENFLPPMKTLNISPPRELFGYPFPIFPTMLADGVCQMLILEKQ